MRIFACCFALLFSVALASEARADKIAILKFEGPQAKTVQKRLQKVLRARGYEVVLVEQPGEEAEVTVSISGKVSKSKKRWQVALELRRGLDGASLAKTTLQAKTPRALAARVETLIWKRFRKALRKVEAPVDETPAETDSEVVDASDTQVDASPESSDLTDSSPVAQVSADSSDLAAGVGARRKDGGVALGPRVVGRRFNYKDDLFGTLTTYEVPATAALAVEADYYPLPQFGVAASYSYTASFNSALNGESSEPFPTTSQGFMVGGRARQSVASALAHLELDYGGHNFTIKGPTAMRPPIPNVRYRFIRVGAGMEVSVLPRVKISAHGGYRHLLSAGEIETQSYFPRLEGAAVDARLSLDFALVSQWRVELAATMERYFFSMNPEVGDALIAGGAADLYRGAQLLLKYRL